MVRHRWLRFLVLIVLNIIIVALLLEAALRIAAPGLPGQIGAVARWVTTGKPYAEDWTPAWQQNIDHYYALRPGIEDQLQYGSATVSFRLSTIELWDGGGIGFRTRPVDYFVDAVVVGDSFGFCFTELLDCWVSQLEAQTGMGIVNLSEPVTGTTSHYRILRDFGKPLEPALVIWQFFGNDFNDDYGLAVFRDEIEPIAGTDAVEANTSPLTWLRRNSVAFAVIETIITGQWYGVPDDEQIFSKPYSVQYGDHILQFGAAYEQHALDMTNAANQIGLDFSRDAFAQAKSLVQAWGGEIVVVVIPTREEVYAHLTAGAMGEDAIGTLTSAREAMFGLCDELALRCFDPFEIFVEHALANEALYYTDDMHLNPQGNAVLATALRDWLEEQDLLPES